MNKKQYIEFNKRYDKFKKNNLPTPFWDEERQTLEYVYFYNGKSFFNMRPFKDELEVNTSLTNALGEIAFTGFYYSFTSKHLVSYKENGEIITKIEIGHDHAHSFEEVVRRLYTCPESFSISKDEEQFYSKQELKYLRRVQKYLLFIGMKDLETRKAPISRYRNKIHSKYEDVCIYRFDDDILKNIDNEIVNFGVIKWYPEYTGDEKYEPNEYRALIVDKEDDFKFFVEFIEESVKSYKDIKKVYKMDNLKDDDKVIVRYFKVLEKF